MIGKGFGSVLRELYKVDNPKIVVGRDVRIHSPQFSESMIKGLTSTGCEVFDIGVTPSPVNYFTVCNGNFDGSVQITASHNPAEDNGIKLQIRNAEAYSGNNLQKLKERIEQNEFLEGEGTVKKYDAISPYKSKLISMFEKVGEGMQIAVDTGNGVSAPVYTDILEGIGCNVTGLYLEQDGTFPNHPADPSKAETLKDLQKEVIENNLNMGFGFDGDGDRMGLVDENGNVRSADEILLLLAKDHLSRNPRAPVVFTVSCSSLLQSEIANWGGVPIMCPVGHSFVEHTMVKNNSILGGEQSGHFFCGENYYGFDDALVATLRLLKILKDSGETISKLCDEFPKVYQMPEKRPFCEDNAKSNIIDRVIKYFEKDYDIETMDGARIDFGDGAWAGIRMSNTSPALSICIEARSEEKMKEVKMIVMEHLKSYPEIQLNS